MSQLESITEEGKKKHLSLSEREIIQKKLRKGVSVREIAKCLERALNTIKPEFDAIYKKNIETTRQIC